MTLSANSASSNLNSSPLPSDILAVSGGPLFEIVLVAPEIPQNTGNIGRIAVCAQSRLHLIRPLGFSFDDKHLKRAGMDYWKHVDFSVHDSWEAFRLAVPDRPLFFFSTKAERSFWDVRFPRGACLIFGSEGHGLDASLHQSYASDFVTIPMPGNFHRSLNLANSVGIAVYEGMRQLRQSSGVTR